jgi:hypothetical protein
MLTVQDIWGLLSGGATLHQNRFPPGFSTSLYLLELLGARVRVSGDTTKAATISTKNILTESAALGNIMHPIFAKVVRRLHYKEGVL